MPRYDDRRKRSTAPSGFNRKIARHNEFPDRNGAWAQIKYWSFSPAIFPNMISAVSPEAKPGDLVTVYDKEGGRFGHGLYNPKARVPLRVIHHGPDDIDESYLDAAVQRALDLRCTDFPLADYTDAFRVIHSDGDGLSGLIIDKYADALIIDVHSLGIMQRLNRWLPILHERLGTKRELIRVDPEVATWEGINRRDLPQTEIRPLKITEHGIRYEVDFKEGHKTGFFCDQRENRLRLSKLTAGKRVADVCCYTGGFSLAAKVKGGAAEVTSVDLDEKAIAQARRNANLNQARLELVHCDAFSWMRQVRENGRRWDVVLLDPPKFIESRETEDEDARKYEDLNSLAVEILEPGGLLVTCSCSGLLSSERFEKHVARAAHRRGRKLQILDRTGAGVDHPVMSNCPESQYLKLLWCRVI
ncbi:MAG: class I SAM-dependent rRNA methyltransferase [Verrucomicrobiae bacterium]|jgi:23S rRNA (cytosine1962-C5)-methyltransferase|nr:class I SAM-dependent rRNA methyltransferase [Verrucomicrobiae bacterium]